MKGSHFIFFTKQSAAALAILWAGGVVLFIYLLFIFDNSVSDNTAPFMQNVGMADTNLSKSDAYVFINVNNKRFLTKFVSTVDIGDTTPVRLIKNRPVVEKITRIITPETQKKPSDFSIKTSPGL